MWHGILISYFSSLISQYFIHDCFMTIMMSSWRLHWLYDVFMTLHDVFQSASPKFLMVLVIATIVIDCWLILIIGLGLAHWIHQYTHIHPSGIIWTTDSFASPLICVFKQWRSTQSLPIKFLMMFWATFRNLILFKQLKTTFCCKTFLFFKFFLLMISIEIPQVLFQKSLLGHLTNWWKFDGFY